VRACAAAGDHGRRQPGGGQVGDDALQDGEGGLVGGAARLAVADVLQVAEIALDPGEPQVRRGVGGAGQGEHLRRLGPGAVLAKVDVDDEVERDARDDGRVREPIDLALVVGDRADGCAGLGEGGDPGGGPGRGGGGDQDVRDPAGHERLSLAHGLAAQADRAAFDCIRARAPHLCILPWAASARRRRRTGPACGRDCGSGPRGRRRGGASGGGAPRLESSFDPYPQILRHPSHKGRDDGGCCF
jgi:hypothetical protein